MKNYDLWLASTKISNNDKINLIKEYKNSENVWYHTIHKDYRGRNYSETIVNLKNSYNAEVIDSIDENIRKNEMKYVTYMSNNYPSSLRMIDNPPFILFYNGDIDRLSDGKAVSLVGSRKCSLYGINATKFITKDICANNINVISGMAKGVDSYAHRTALENGGFTCAVLGCGIDVIYPRENRVIYNEISKNGCIISEFMPGTQPLPYHFPMRNRIISALSDMIIVIEAGIKSGSLITASCALDQGKDVMAVPGSIFSEQSQGTNKLIRDGAYPFTCMEDIYNLMGLKRMDKYEREKPIRNERESKIFSILSDSPLHIDDIIRMADIDIKQLYELLFEMQLKDEIMCLAGNYYVKANG
jgi:DNA processing protein